MKQISKESTLEVIHVDHVSSHFSPPIYKACNLLDRKVQRFHLKKLETLLQKLVEMESNPARKVAKKVSINQDKDLQQTSSNSQDELWRDMMRPHEERHYQIGRITNYFS